MDTRKVVAERKHNKAYKEHEICHTVQRSDNRIQIGDQWISPKTYNNNFDWYIDESHPLTDKAETGAGDRS